MWPGQPTQVQNCGLCRGYPPERIFSAVNSSNHLEAYQFSSDGSNTALQAACFQDANGNWTALAKSPGVDSVATFLSSPTAQDLAFQNYTEKNFDYLHANPHVFNRALSQNYAASFSCFQVVCKSGSTFVHCASGN